MPRVKRTAEKAVSEIINLKEIFETEKGQEVLFALAKRFHYFQSSYNGDVNDTLFREGERNVINFIMTQLQQSPDKLLKEYRNRLAQELSYEEESL